MTVNYTDELISAENLKVSDFIQSQAKDSTVSCHEAEHQNHLMLKQQMNNC